MVVDTSVPQLVLSGNVASLKMLADDSTWKFIESTEEFRQLTETRLDAVISELEEILLVLIAQSQAK